MITFRHLLLLAFISLALGSLVMASNDDNNAPETSNTANDGAESDGGISVEHMRIANHPSKTEHRNSANDLTGMESPVVTHSSDADNEDGADSVDGVDRHHGHHSHGKGSNKCKDECDPCKKKNECCCKHRPTPTYHISLCKQDETYKTISLPAQGHPFYYGDDIRHSSVPPLVNPFHTQGYCYEPCCQPTGGLYGSLPPQRLCKDRLVPCHNQPPPCCCPPPPPCGCPPPPCGCPPPPCCCPPPCGCPPPPCGCPPPPCGCPPPPYCDCCPPPPYVYDECLDKHKHKKGHKGHKNKHDRDYD